MIITWSFRTFFTAQRCSLTTHRITEFALTQFQYLQKTDIKYFIETYGINGIYQDDMSNVFSNSLYPSIAQILIYETTSTSSTEFFLIEHLLCNLGTALLSHPHPWIKRHEQKKLLKKSLDLILPTILAESINIYNLDPNAIFGLITLLAPLFELHYVTTSDSYLLVSKINSSRYPLYRLTHHIFSALFEFKPDFRPQNVIEEMNRLHFSSQQRRFIWRWIRRDICLVE